MEIISSKATLSLTTTRWKWLHEEAWDDNQRIFANECKCFSSIGPQKTTWLSRGGKGRPDPLNCGFLRAGRWILQDIETQKLQMAAQLQWENGLFQSSWIAVSGTIPSDVSPESHPLNWLLEALIRRLRPDVITVSGDIPASMLEEFSTSQIRITHPVGNPPMVSERMLRFDSKVWETFQGAHKARDELAWVRKRAEREQKEQERAHRPRTRPFLVRLIMSINPLRRMRSEKMIHPLTKYQQR